MEKCSNRIELTVQTSGKDWSPGDDDRRRQLIWRYLHQFGLYDMVAHPLPFHPNSPTGRSHQPVRQLKASLIA